MQTRQQQYLAAFGTGMISGMRSMSGPAWVAQSHYRGRIKQAILAMAAGELIVDKLSIAPDRTDVAPLSMRTILGASAAAVACVNSRSDDEQQLSRTRAALAGAAGAIAVSYLHFHLRQGIKRRYGIKDVYVALVEDAIMLATGALVFGKAGYRDPGDDAMISEAA